MHESRSSGLLVCFAFCRYSTVPLSLLLVFLFTGGSKQERKEGGRGKRGGGGRVAVYTCTVSSEGATKRGRNEGGSDTKAKVNLLTSGMSQKRRQKLPSGELHLRLLVADLVD